MRRDASLFHIIQILRRSSRPVTAAALADELETSKRSIYRDIAALIGQRVPIRGEAGFGYVLEGGFDLPPLMLTTEEVEAAVLGAQWDGYRFELESLVDGGESIVGIGCYRGTFRATGKFMQARVAHVWQLQGGQIVAFEQFTDTLLVRRAM